MTISRRNLIKMIAGAAPLAALPKAFSSGAPLIPKIGSEQNLHQDNSFENFRKYNFNSDWKVVVSYPKEAFQTNFNDTDWKKVTLPYAWNEDDAFRKDIKDLSTGIAWYRKHFKLPESFKNKKIFFECEGIRQAGDFYVNGKHVGLSENGVMAFGFDITHFLNFGEKENVIAARIDNSWDYRERSTNSRFQWNDHNFYANYGGINKNVYLYVTNKLYQTLPLYSNLGTTGVYIYANEIDIPNQTATIHAESQVKNDENETQKVEYEVIVTDLNGKRVKQFKGEKATVAPGETKILKASSRLKIFIFGAGGTVICTMWRQY